MFNILLTLAATLVADYRIYPPAPGIEIKGVGMGASGDYRTVRGEDRAFLTEAWAERAEGITRYPSAFNPYPATGRVIRAWYPSPMLDYAFAPSHGFGFEGYIWQLGWFVPPAAPLPATAIHYLDPAAGWNVNGKPSDATNFLSVADYVIAGVSTNLSLQGILRRADVMRLYAHLPKTHGILGVPDRDDESVPVGSRRLVNYGIHYNSGAATVNRVSYELGTGTYTIDGVEKSYDYNSGYTLTSTAYPAWEPSWYPTDAAMPYVEYSRQFTSYVIPKVKISVSGSDLIYTSTELGRYISDSYPISSRTLLPPQNDDIEFAFTHLALQKLSVPSVDLIRSVRAFLVMRFAVELRTQEYQWTFGAGWRETSQVLERIVATASVTARYLETSGGQLIYGVSGIGLPALMTGFANRHLSRRVLDIEEKYAPLSAPTNDLPYAVSGGGVPYTMTKALHVRLADVSVTPLIHRDWLNYCPDDE